MDRKTYNKEVKDCTIMVEKVMIEDCKSRKFTICSTNETHFAKRKLVKGERIEGNNGL